MSTIKVIVGWIIAVLSILSKNGSAGETTTVTPNSVQASNCGQRVPQDCTEIRDCSSKHPESGIYTIQPSTYPEPFYVYCDMDTDGGGWTIFQKRVDSTVWFYRTWEDYKRGFGNLNLEFWMGNERLFYLVAQGDYELRVDLADFENQRRFAVYDFFRIGDEGNHYKLFLGQYRGNAGDSLDYQRGMFFSTKDRDHDIYNGNCAVSFKGAWWYSSCHSSNLNGLYHGGPHSSYADGVNWSHWRGQYYSLKRTEMKVRRLA